MWLHTIIDFLGINYRPVFYLKRTFWRQSLISETFLNKNRIMDMSRRSIIVLIYHCHKVLDLMWLHDGNNTHRSSYRNQKQIWRCHHSLRCSCMVVAKKCIVQFRIHRYLILMFLSLDTHTHACTHTHTQSVKWPDVNPLLYWLP
jgi:hypothetical protein